jgi:hypothetical protein
MRFLTLALLLLTTPAHAQSVFLSYSQWAQLPKNLREIYVAGAFDTLSTVTTPEQVSYVKHYNECVAKAALNLSELAENVKEYAATQPDVQSKPVPTAIMRYLISLCGLPRG